MKPIVRYTAILLLSASIFSCSDSSGALESEDHAFQLPQNMDEMYKQVFLVLKNKDKTLFSNLCPPEVTEHQLDSIANLYYSPEQKAQYEANKQQYIDASNEHRKMLLADFDEVIANGEQKGIVWSDIGFRSGRDDDHRIGNGVEQAELFLKFEHKTIEYSVEISGVTKQSNGWSIVFLDGFHLRN